VRPASNEILKRENPQGNPKRTKLESIGTIKSHKENTSERKEKKKKSSEKTKLPQKQMNDSL